MLSTTASIIYDKVKLALNEILPDDQIYVHLLKIQIQQVEYKFEEIIQTNECIQGDRNYNDYTKVPFLETLFKDQIDQKSESLIKQSECNNSLLSLNSQNDLEYNISYSNEIDTKELDNLIQTLSRLIICQSVEEFDSIAIYQKEIDQKQNNSILITLKLTKKCFMNLKFYSFPLLPDSQPVTINFQQAEILNEHQEFIPVIQDEFTKCIKVTDLNFLYITAEDLIQMKLDIPKTRPILIFLSPYFQYHDLDKLRLETYLIYDNMQTQQEESIIIIINIVGKLKLKIEILLNNCQYCHSLNNTFQTHLYFKINHPPICSAALYDKTKIDFLDTQTEWTRIENIYLNSYFQKHKNVLEKYVILNNTIIEVQLNNVKSCQEVRILNQLQLRLKQKKILYDNQIQFNIVKQTERNSKFDTLQQQLDKSNLSFEQKYNFICILSQNRIIDCHHLKTLLILICKQQQNQDCILDSVFQSFMRLSQNLSSSIRISDQNNRNLIIFQKELSCQIQQNASLKRPILVKQIRLTPSGYIPMISQPEKQKLLTTLFQHQNFVKLSLRDDNGKLIKKNKSNFGEFFKIQLMEGFTIFAEKWKLLGWNNKELRSNILWMNKVSYKELDNFFLTNFKSDSSILQQQTEDKSSFWNFFIDGQTIEFKQLIIIVINNQIHENNVSQFGQISGNLIGKIREILKNKEVSVVKVVFNGIQYVLQLNNNLKDNTIQLYSKQNQFSNFNDVISRSLFEQRIDQNFLLDGYQGRYLYLIIELQNLIPNNSLGHLGQISKSIIVRSVSLDLKSELCGLSPIIDQINLMKGNNLNEKNCLFIQKVYEKLKLLEIQQLKQKYNILVEKAERLFGVFDQYGILNEGEVICVRKSNDQLQYLEGKLIVVEDCSQSRQMISNVIGLSRIEVIGRLRDNKAYDEYINCIIFSNKQQNSTPFCTNTYFVSWDKRLIPKSKRINKTKVLQEFEFLKFELEELTDYLCDFLNNQFSQDVDCNHIGLQQHHNLDSHKDIFKLIDQFMVDKPQQYQVNKINIDERFIYRFYWIKEENNYEQYVKQYLGEMHILKALKCLNHIVDTFNSWMKLYDIKDEYEMYSGYFESKMNEENAESFQELMMLNLGQLKMELYNILSQIEQERLIQIWIIHFLVIYLPNEINSESHLLERIVKCVRNQVQKFDDCKFLCSRLTNRSQQWFNGCSWYFFRREIINFEQSSKNE